MSSPLAETWNVNCSAVAVFSTFPAAETVTVDGPSCAAATIRAAIHASIIVPSRRPPSVFHLVVLLHLRPERPDARSLEGLDLLVHFAQVIGVPLIEGLQDLLEDRRVLVLPCADHAADQELPQVPARVLAPGAVEVHEGVVRPFH